MPGEALTLQIEVEIIALILVALVVYIVARRLRMPYTITLVLTGITIGLLGPALLQTVFPIGLSEDLILLVFLPGLIFEAAYHISLDNLRQNIGLILGLAVPGMLISAGVVGGLVHLLLGLPWSIALLFGALISATDPISVLALFKELRVPKRLSIVMEGESLFNDGTAVVLFRLLLAVALGETITLSEGISQFFVVMVGGAAIGFIIGLLVNMVMTFVQDDNAIKIALTIIVAYGTFLLAEELLHVSPVIAVVVAGVTLGSGQRAESSTLGAQISIADFWELVAFLINSAIFLLIGLESPLGLLQAGLLPILVAIIPVLLARMVVIYFTGWLSRRMGKNPIPKSWDTVLFWGGLRGTVSLALALSLPLSFPGRQVILTLTLGYVTFSLVVGGLTMKPLLQRFGLTRRPETRERWESLLAQLQMVQATQQSVDRLSQQHLLPPQLDQNFRIAVDRSLERYWTEMERLLLTDPDLLQERTQYILNEIVRDRRAALMNLEKHGFISEHTYHVEIEALLQRIQKSTEAENSEQVFTVLTDLIGQWDQRRDLRHLLRGSPEMSALLARSYLSRAAAQSLEDVVEARGIFVPFIADELRPFLKDLSDKTRHELNVAINHHEGVQIQASRMVFRELLDSQRSALSQMLRTGLLSDAGHLQLSQRLDTIEGYGREMTDSRELNALMLAIPGMIRHLSDTWQTPAGEAAPVEEEAASPAERTPGTDEDPGVDGDRRPIGEQSPA